MTSLKQLRQQSRGNPPALPIKQVAIIVEMGFAPAQDLLRGIADYVQQHDPWAIYLKPYGVDAPANWFRDWRGHGIMVYAASVQDQAMLDCKIPIVDLTGHHTTERIPLVRLHDEAIGRVGAEHLIDRGFQNFAFFENSEFEWSQRRRDGFIATLKSRGLGCQLYSTHFATNRIGSPQLWEERQQRLVEWLRESLPKPAGVMAASDLMGQNLLEACQRADIHVPEEVAVIGVDNDETICRIASPPLSSVIANHSGRGYAAAQLLDQLIAGKKPPAGPVLVEPAGVAARASTDIMAIDDPTVVKTLRILRERACSSIGVDQIVNEIASSRTVLQRKFRKAVGRSIHEEIVRLRLNRAIELLNDTSLEIKAIAQKSGFKSQAYMTAVFHERLGRTPGSYRSYVPASGE